VTPQEHMDFATKSAEEQLRLNRKMVEDHLDECDRIAARRVTEAISAASLAIIADPTT
jgi:hypothetical protein